MVATTPFIAKMTADEFVAWERGQSARHQLIDGHVYDMAGGSPRHSHLAASALREIGNAVRGGPCRAFTSDLQVHVPATGNFVYPDAAVVCGPIELRDKSGAATNPRVVVEVLSSGTERHDRGDKWKDYQSIASLTEYVLVSQRAARIEVFRRDADGAWSYRAFGPGERVDLSTGGIAVDDVYEGAFDLPGDE